MDTNGPAVRRLATRRAVLSAPAALLGAGVLSACAAGGAPPPGSGRALAPATLSFTTWWVPPLAFGVGTEKAIQGFEAKHPNVKVKVEGLANNANQNLEKVQTLVAAGTPPDLSLIRPPHMGFFANRGAFVAVDDRLQSDRRSRADFFPVALERLSWQGKTWGLPAEVWFLVNVYNQELFSAAGQPAPDGNWTWDRWLEAARRLTAAGASAPARSYGTEVPQWEALVWAWGGEVLSRAETECVLNRPPAPEALQWRADAIVKHAVVPPAAELGGQSMLNFFNSGRLGMYPVGNWALVDVEKGARMKWSVAPLPAGKAGAVTFAAGANYALFAGTKQLDAGWALLSDLVFGDGLKALLQESSLFPAYKPLAKEELLPSYKKEWLQATLKAGEKARHPHYNHPKHTEIYQVLNEQLAPLWRGDKSAQQAADEAARQINPLLK
jgi:multiple sugar transport system substrate-binding protein